MEADKAGQRGQNDTGNYKAVWLTLAKDQRWKIRVSNAEARKNTLCKRELGKGGKPGADSSSGMVSLACPRSMPRRPRPMGLQQQEAAVGVGVTIRTRLCRAWGQVKTFLYAEYKEQMNLCCRKSILQLCRKESQSGGGVR